MILECTIYVECSQCGEEDEVYFDHLPSDGEVRNTLERDIAWKCTPLIMVCDICYHDGLDDDECFHDDLDEDE